MYFLNNSRVAKDTRTSQTLCKLAHIFSRPKRLALLLLWALLIAVIIVYSIDDVYVAHDRVGSARYLKERILKSLGLAFNDGVPFQWNGEVGDKVIVMAHTHAEDVSWVKDQLPDWQRAIYNVELTHPVGESLVVPENKGHEAMAYLTYIIDHYDSLPSILLFLHAHRDGYWKAWHTDAPLHDNVLAARALQLPFVEEQGYVNLRCKLHPGCVNGPKSGAEKTLTPEIWNGFFGNSSTPPRWLAMQVESYEPIPTDPRRFDYNIDHLVDRVPEIRVACCAQFAVSRSSVLQRSKGDYISFRQWLLNTNLPDRTSGRVFEYLWHIIFGELGVHCPDADFCYCAVFGRC